jgi:hypothetical protein
MPRASKLRATALIAFFLTFPVATFIEPPRAFGSPVATSTDLTAPLSDEEKTLLTSIVLKDPELDEVLQTQEVKRICLMYSVARENTSDRFGDVLLYAPASGFGASVLVNITKRTVIGRDKLRPRDIPLAPDDLKEAIGLASTEAHLKYKLQDAPQGYYDFTGSLIRATDPDDPCFNSRCVSVSIRHKEQYLPVSIVVDLKTGKVETDWEFGR